MKIANTMRQYIYKYESLYAIGCGSLLIVGGAYLLLSGTGSIYFGIGYMLMGLSFITSIYLKRKWIRIFPFLTMFLAMWVMIFKPFSDLGDNIASKEGGRQQEAVIQAAKPHNTKSIFKKKGLKQTDVPVDPFAGATSDTFDSMRRLMPPDLRDDPMLQKLMEVTSSDSFQAQVKEQNPQTIQEYVNLLEAHGVTGLSEMGIEKQIADSYDFMAQKYQAENPGKAPEEEDEVMAKRFGEVLKESGLMKGTESFMTDQENVLWISARFKGDEAAFNEWWRDVMAVYESDDSATRPLTQRDSESTPGEFFDIPLAETEQGSSDRALLEMWEEPAITDPQDRGVTPPPVEQENIVTQVSPEPPALATSEALETTLSEQFSSERFKRAMDTLERYGPEEGLRRLRESDPEVAEQLQRQRNREDRASDESRPAEDY